MKRFRDPNWVLILLFASLIAAVPLVQIVLEATDENGVIALDLFSEVPTAANLRAYERKLEDANWAARLTRPWLQFAQFAWLKHGGEKVVVGSSGWYFYKPGLNYMLARPEVTQATMATNDPVRAIVDFRDQLSGRGIQLLVMPVPNKDSVYPDRLSSRAQMVQGVVTPRTREFLQSLRAAKIEVVDLFEEFARARRESGSKPEVPLYLAQDTHWSPEGVAVAARAAARRLKELGWVHPGNVEYAEHSAPAQRVGDLVQMLKTPMIERTITPERVSSVQVTRDDGEPYTDQAEAEVLVLGDSFMRIYQQDAPNSAGFVAHLAKELKQPLLSLVNDGGGSTLVREELCARPGFLKNKKVVLWEFVERDLGIGIKGWQRTPLPPLSSGQKITGK